MLMEISVRDLHNDMIKLSENGGLESLVVYVTQKVMIRGTTLRSFIPQQVRKLTPKKTSDLRMWDFHYPQGYTDRFN